MNKTLRNQQTHRQHPPQKPRMYTKTFRHDERYDAATYPAAIDAYDATLTHYWKEIARSDGLPWSEAVASRLHSVYYPQVKSVAAMQGLLNDK